MADLLFIKDLMNKDMLDNESAFGLFNRILTG
jgi:hypothetical protein